MAEYTLITPLEVYLPRKTKDDKKFALNLNIYRNTYFQVLNQAKSVYNDLMKEQISKLPQFEHLEEVDYIIYKKSAREFDTPNLGSIISKFFMDALVIYKKIPDDNYKITPRHVIDFGGISDHDYCEIKLKGKIMQFQIQLDHQDIIDAIAAKFGAQLPAGFINNLKFDVKEGKLTAACACDNPRGNMPPKEPVINTESEVPFEEPSQEKSTEVHKEGTVSSARRVRTANIAEEFAKVQEGNNKQDTVSGDTGDSGNTGDTAPAGDSSQAPSPSANEEASTVETVKTNTFGARSVRRRII